MRPWLTWPQLWGADFAPVENGAAERRLGQMMEEQPKQGCGTQEREV